MGVRSRVVTFFTDADLVAAREGKGPSGIRHAIGQSRVVAEMIRCHGYQRRSEPAVVPANGARLPRPLGDGWLAVGDAACAYDPLSGHGVIAAMDSARLAALSVTAFVKGDRRALARYANTLAAGYARYRTELATNYAL